MIPGRSRRTKPISLEIKRDTNANRLLLPLLVSSARVIFSGTATDLGTLRKRRNFDFIKLQEDIANKAIEEMSARKNELKE